MKTMRNKNKESKSKDHGNIWSEGLVFNSTKTLLHLKFNLVTS